MIQDYPHSIQSYWYFRGEITYEDGILYKGTQLITPEMERKATLSVLYMGHYTVSKMNLRARENSFTGQEFLKTSKTTYQICTICAKFARTVQKQTL